MNILIVRADRLGDILLTLPMACAIKNALPNARVTFLAREYTRPIIERCPDVDEVITPKTFHLLELIRIFRQSKTDAAFFPGPRFRLVLAAWLARIPIRIGTVYRWYSFLFNRRVFEHRKMAERHEAEYNLRMLSQLSIIANMDELPKIVLREDEMKSVDEWLRTNIPGGIFSVLHISSGGSTIQYPAGKFVELGKYIRQRYDMAIILTGLELERELLDRAAKSIGIGAQLFIGRPLLELAALLARANVVVSIGTGPGHLAATMAAPTIGLFPLPLAISKERWGFRGAHVINLSPAPVESCPNCSPCICMERLTMETVTQSADELLLGEQLSKFSA